MDDEKAKTLNEKVYAELESEIPEQSTSSVEEAQPEEELVEEEFEETEAEEESEVEEDADVSDEPDSKESKRSVKSRISELTHARNEEREKREELERKLEAMGTNQEDIGLELPDYSGLPEGEISKEDYQKHVAQTAQAMVKIEIQRERNTNRIQKELSESMTEYTELDPKAENFDTDLSDSVTEATQAFIKANPNGNVKAYIDKMMKPFKRSVEKAVGRQTETIAKQVSQKALRPTQSKQTGTKFADLSIEEMEKRLGKVY